MSSRDPSAVSRDPFQPPGKGGVSSLGNVFATVLRLGTYQGQTSGSRLDSLSFWSGMDLTLADSVLSPRPAKTRGS